MQKIASVIDIVFAKNSNIFTQLETKLKTQGILAAVLKNYFICRYTERLKKKAHKLK